MSEAVIERKKKRRSERGNWLVVTYINGKIYWCTWVQTWGGVQQSRRNAERDRPAHLKVSVVVLDIERMMDFAVTEGANEIHDLERLLRLE